MKTRIQLDTATNKAIKQFQRALPHIEAARTILADALEINPEEKPVVDPDNSPEHWKAVRLMQNVWAAHLHITDLFGS